MTAGQDSTQLIIALVNSVRDDLKSDINDLRGDLNREIESRCAPKSSWSFDFKHWIFIGLLLISVSFNVGRESSKINSTTDTTSSNLYKVTKSAISSTGTDVTKYYKLTNGNM